MGDVAEELASHAFELSQLGDIAPEFLCHVVDGPSQRADFIGGRDGNP